MVRFLRKLQNYIFYKIYKITSKVVLYCKAVVNLANNKSISNKNTFESYFIVKSYGYTNDLTIPEKTVLDILKNDLRNMRMLDIGVGTGRTTLHFADLVKEYIGIDYSTNMVNACKTRFPETSRMNFLRCDVRSMEVFDDKYFDFILFSFNGIDCISYNDRLIAFEQIKRIGKHNALFCFSTHNIQFIHKLFTIHYSANIIRTTQNIFKSFLLRSINKNIKGNEKYAVINDGAHMFGLNLFYIKPHEQIRQLYESGFNNIRVFSSENGEEIKDFFTLENNTEMYLYYLCNINN